MFRKLLDKFASMGGNTLYYPGCMSRFAAPEYVENYRKILQKMEVDFIEIPEFNCCGSPVVNAGFEEDFIGLIKKNLDIFKKYGVKRIITNCPSCCKVFRKDYEIRTFHITEVIAENLDKLEKIYDDEPVCYHDPCHLGRGLGIYEAPRRILEVVGFEITEMDNTKERSLCCGAGGGLKANNPKLSDEIGKKRMSQCKTKKLVTSCAMCVRHLKENSKGVEVLELSEVL